MCAIVEAVHGVGSDDVPLLHHGPSWTILTEWINVLFAPKHALTLQRSVRTKLHSRTWMPPLLRKSLVHSSLVPVLFSHCLQPSSTLQPCSTKVSQACSGASKRVLSACLIRWVLDPHLRGKGGHPDRLSKNVRWPDRTGPAQCLRCVAAGHPVVHASPAGHREPSVSHGWS